MWGRGSFEPTVASTPAIRYRKLTQEIYKGEGLHHDCSGERFWYEGDLVAMKPQGIGKAVWRSGPMVNAT